MVCLNEAMFRSQSITQRCIMAITRTIEQKLVRKVEIHSNLMIEHAHASWYDPDKMVTSNRTGSWTIYLIQDEHCNLSEVRQRLETLIMRRLPKDAKVRSVKCGIQEWVNADTSIPTMTFAEIEHYVKNVKPTVSGLA